MADLNVGIHIGATMDGSVGGTVGRAVNQLNRVGDGTEALQRRVTRLGRAYGDLNAARERRVARRGALFETTALAAGVLAPIVGATRAAIRFESVMADVRKVVDFDTPQQFAQMGQDVLRLSTRIPVAASGIGDIVAAAGQAGIARRELTRFAEDAAKVAVAFDISGAEAGGRLTGLRSIFKLNQDGVMRLAGAYNHLSNNMDATAPAMLNIAERAGSVAEQFGLSGQEVGALSATFLALKTPPEVAGTAINALLLRLQNAPSQAQGFQDALDELGMSAEELKEDIENDAQGALLRFLEAVDGAEDKSGILFALFGQEYSDDITKLAGNLDLYRQAIGLAADEKAALTSIEEEYAARASTTENQLTLLANQTNVLGVNIGTVLLPAVNDAVGVVGELVSQGAALAAEYPEVTQVVIGLVVGLTLLAVGARVGGYAATFLSEGWAIARIGMLRTGGAVAWLGRGLVGLARNPIPTAIGALRLLRLALIGTGIGAAVVLIGTAAALIMRYWEPIAAFFDGFATGISAAFEPLEPIFNWIGEAFTALAGPVDFAAEELEGFRSTGESVGRIVGAVFNGLLWPIRKVIEGTGSVLRWLGLIDDTEIEASIANLDQERPEPPRPVRQAAGAAVVAAGLAAAPAAAAPPEFSTPAFPAVAPASERVVGATEPEVDPEAVRRDIEQQVRDAGGFAGGAAPAGPRPEASLTFHQTFYFQGAGPEVEDEIARRMEAIMRRASVEAGLVEAEDAF